MQVRYFFFIFLNVLQSLCLTAHPGVTEASGVIEAYPGVQSLALELLKSYLEPKGPLLKQYVNNHDPDAQPGVHALPAITEVHLGVRLNPVIVVGHSPPIKFFPGVVEVDPGVTIVPDKRIRAQQAFSTHRCEQECV